MEKFFRSKWFIIILSAAIVAAIVIEWSSGRKQVHTVSTAATPDYWVAPSLYLEPVAPGEDRQLLAYGRDLIAHTSWYLGPKGKVAAVSNGMNCQNCHLNAGGKAFGNNYGAVASTYPKFRERSGKVESVRRRVNDCFERSLNGTAIDSNSREMQAIVAYMEWLGKNVPKGEKPKGSGITTLTYMDRAASPVMGKLVYTDKCQSCHGVDGQGLKDGNGVGYDYPPLWGEHSYNSGAGLYRLSRFAGYVKDNMPFGPATNHAHPQLTDEEAWDVAAFVNSQPRPQKDLSGDWPDIAGKPFDHPFGPYADSFSEMQHKYGPFQPIIAAKQKKTGTSGSVK